MLNLPEAIQEVSESTGNKSKIESLNRLTEEFYRTLSLLFYSRYVTMRQNDSPIVHPNVFNYVVNSMRSPTFADWMRLGQLCAQHLLEQGDAFAKRYVETARSPVDSSQAQKAQQIVSKISGFELKGPPKVLGQLTYESILESMRNLRNFRAHKWDNDSKLRPLIDLGIEDIVVSVVKKLIEPVSMIINVPLQVSREGTETIIIDGTHVEKSLIKERSNVIGHFEACYLQFSDRDEPFESKTNLIQYDKYNRTLYVYTNYENGRAVYQCVPLQGQICEKEERFESLEEAFDLPRGTVEGEKIEDILEERYGKFGMTGDVIHNLPPRMEGYVRRPATEAELLDNLDHPRLYIITMDGGGGYGKTELAKDIVWRIVEGDFAEEHPSLKFDHVVWLTGMIDYYVDGAVERRRQSFNTMSDLLDCILYVTGNSLAVTDRGTKSKRQIVTKALNACTSVLLLLDNLETVTEKDDVFAFLIELGRTVKSQIKVIITTRIRGDRRPELPINVRAMEESEATELVSKEMQKRGVQQETLPSGFMERILRATGGIPLLITHIATLLARSRDFDETMNGFPADRELALRFMCNYQWNQLSEDGKKLLLSVAYNGGSVAFGKAIEMCGFTRDDFERAKNDLSTTSFLVDSMLRQSILQILPPIVDFARMKQQEDYPELEEEFYEGRIRLETLEESSPAQYSVLEEAIPLHNIHQRVDLLVQKGAIEEAYTWCRSATDRYPKNESSWRVRGSFESRHLEDYKSAIAHLERAIDLAPSEPAAYAELAYVYFQRGERNKGRPDLEKAVELAKKAAERASTDDAKMRYHDYMASALMKLAYLMRERWKTADRFKRRDIETHRDNYFAGAIEVLKENLYQKPLTYVQRNHNLIDYGMLIPAHLFLAKSRDARLNNAWAAYYLVEALEIDIRNDRLLGSVKQEGVMSAIGDCGTVIDFGLPPPSVAQAILHEGSRVKSCLEELIGTRST